MSSPGGHKLIEWRVIYTRCQLGRRLCLSVLMDVHAALICNICVGFYGLQASFITCLVLFYHSPVKLILVFSQLHSGGG